MAENTDHVSFRLGDAEEPLTEYMERNGDENRSQVIRDAIKEYCGNPPVGTADVGCA